MFFTGIEKITWTTCKIRHHVFSTFDASIRNVKCKNKNVLAVVRSSNIFRSSSLVGQKQKNRTTETEIKSPVLLAFIACFNCHLWSCWYLTQVTWVSSGNRFYKKKRKRRKKKNVPERSVFSLFFELGKERGPRSVKLWKLSSVNNQY